MQYYDKVTTLKAYIDHSKYLLLTLQADIYLCASVYANPAA